MLILGLFMSDTPVVTVADKVPTVAPTTQTSYDKVAGVAGLLDISNPTDDQREQLIKIGDYFRSQSKELSEIDLLNKVRQLEIRLGLPDIGETRLDRINRYVTIQRQLDGLEKERERLLR